MNSHGWRTLAGALLALTAVAPSLPAAQESPIVPGRMGPNALPAIPVEDAALPTSTLAEIGGAAHVTGPGGADRAFTPEFKLVVPFGGFAAVEIEGTPLEVWRVSPETQQRFNGRATSGVAKGDVAFGARFQLFREAERRPAVALRFITKSTTGKGLEDRRFTDAPAYAIETLAAKSFRTGSQLVPAVRVLGKLGFLAWSQQPGLQDDALDYGAAVDALFRSGTELRVEIRGYQGYQSQDKPMLAAVRVLQPVWRRADVLLGVNRGLRSDAPDWELRAGLQLRLRTPFGG
jgi:hypothetical protein